MFAAVGNHVVSLHRASVGGLAIPDDLAPGEFMVRRRRRDSGHFCGRLIRYGAIFGSVTIYGYVMIFAGVGLNRLGFPA